MHAQARRTAWCHLWFEGLPTPWKMQRRATLVHSSNTLFILIGAVMVLAMHAGFAFLEVGTVRQKPGQCPVEDPQRLCGLDTGLLLYRLLDFLRVNFLHRPPCSVPITGMAW